MKSGKHINRRYCAATPTSGFTLLEILVAMIILLIGILAVVQLFPGGFLTIQRTGEQTIAVQLADEQLADQRSRSALADYYGSGLPDDQGRIQDIQNISPDDLRDETDTSILQIANGSTPPFTLFPGYLPYFFSNINRVRFIKGEPLRVPISNPNVYDTGTPSRPYGALYMLPSGPVFNYFNPPGTPITDSLSVYGTPLNRVIQSALATIDQPDPRPSLPNENVYAIDYDNHLIAFFPRVGAKTRKFHITYDYYDKSVNPPTLNTRSGDILVPDVNPTMVVGGVAAQPVWQDIFSAANVAPAGNAQNIRHESEDVSRGFVLVTQDYKGQTQLGFDGSLAPNWTDDPYEYAWFSKQFGNANPGVLVFNPRGHVSYLTNKSVTDPEAQTQAQSFTNVQSLVARVDYLIYDNHIIRDQRTVPSSAPYTIKLSLPLVMTYGDLLDDQSTYTGIFQGDVGPDVLIYNPNTGQEIGEISKSGQTGGTVGFTLSSIPGSITLNQSDVENADPNKDLRGKPLRILYRTQKNWGAQVQKASSLYTQVGAIDSVTYKTYFMGDGTTGKTTRLYFSPSEAGKTITIGEFYLANAGGPVTTPFKNETFKIQDDTTQFESLGASGLRYPWIDVIDKDHEYNGGYTGFTAAPTGRAVNYVRGLSIKSRIIWKDRDRYRQINEDSVLPTDRL